MDSASSLQLNGTWCSATRTVPKVLYLIDTYPGKGQEVALGDRPPACRAFHQSRHREGGPDQGKGRTLRPTKARSASCASASAAGSNSRPKEPIPDPPEFDASGRAVAIWA